MSTFIGIDFLNEEGAAKLERYRLEATQARLLPRTPVRSKLARGLHRLAERLEPSPAAAARQSPRPTP